MTTDGAPCFRGALNPGVTGGFAYYCQAASKKNEKMSPSKCRIELSSCHTSKVHSNLSLRPPVRKDITCLKAPQNDDGWRALFFGRAESRCDWGIRVFLPSRIKKKNEQMSPSKCHIELSSCHTSKIHSNLSLRPPVRKDITCLKAAQNDDVWGALFLGRAESWFDGGFANCCQAASKKERAVVAQQMPHRAKFLSHIRST